jgi:hypothetical protein
MSGRQQNVAEDPANLRQAYQVAASLYMQENTITWARFNTMLTANSFIVSAFSIGARQSSELAQVAHFFPFFGLFICVVWLAMMERGFMYHNIWREEARKVEVMIFGEATHGLPHTLVEGEKLRNGFLNKVLNARYFARAIIFAFAAFYLNFLAYRSA